MIGRLISGRYRIEAVVGTGGMAVVYRAQDLRKKKTVAIKVLRREYESDMEFVRRFSREAEAAAKVSHENIVNLLDVGIEGDTRYIVMEYIDGQTLKQMIQAEGSIHPEVALRMTIRILAAVDHAHRNGIVHRDIKSQNILVDKEGRVKVADFGIARLKTAQASQLDQNGNALGSVHYLSPEQARGEIADEQSDLYSVGIVLYEMLTGTVPFDGDTAVSVAMMHVSETPKSMRLHKAHISRALDEVVTRALCKDKEKRYQSAAEMAADLRKTIENPRGGFVQYPPSREEIERAREEKKRKAPAKPRRRTRHAGNILIFLLAGCMLLVSSLYMRRDKNNVIMPGLLGMTPEQAVAELAEIGIQAMLVSNYSEHYPEGQVMLQSVAEGQQLHREGRVTLTISLGSQWYQLEDYIGWDAQQAAEAAIAAGAKQVVQEFVQSDLPAGCVVSVDQPSGRTSRDTVIVFRVSGQMVAVPKLSGMTLGGAQAVLEAEGLALGSVTEEDSPDAQSGTVISQGIAPNMQVMVGTEVDLVLCKPQQLWYAPSSALSLVVPLNGLNVVIDMVTPSGQSIELFSETLAAGTHSVEMHSQETGIHKVYIYMDNVLMESMQLNFE